MDDPHILDVLLGRLGPATPAQPENLPAPPKPKRGKKRQSAPVKMRSKAGNRKDPKGGTPQSPVIAVLSDDALRRNLAHATVRCVTFYSLEQPQDVVEQSATFLEALLRLWALRGIDARAVWREIDHRVQLGNLLNQINRDIPASTDSTRKYWRPSLPSSPDRIRSRTPMENSADIAVLFVLLVSALWGSVRGFAREVFSLVAWLGSFVLAARVAPLILPWITQKVSDPLAATALAYIVSFIVLVLVLSTVAQRLASGLRSVLVGGTDKLLGCLFGVARGYILLVVLYLVCVSVAGADMAHSLIAGSKSGPYILDGVNFVRKLMPYFPQLHLAMPPATGHEAAF